MRRKLWSILIQTIAILPILTTIASSAVCPYISLTNSGWTGKLKRCYTFTWGVSTGVNATVSYERCEYVGTSGHSGMITMNKALVDRC